MQAYFRLTLYRLKHGLINLVLLLVLLLALAFVLKLVFIDNTQLKSVPIALIDMDKTPSSQRIMDQLHQKEILHIKPLTFEAALKALRNHEIEAVITLNQGLEAAFIKGDYQKTIDIIYLDRSTSAPALADVIAGGVLGEASVYHASLQVGRYDPSEDAQQEILKKVRDSIEQQAYHLPLETAVRSPLSASGSDAPLPFDNQLPVRLSIGYTLFAMLLISTFFALQLAKDIKSPIGNRLATSPQPLWLYIGYHLISGALGIVILFGGLSLALMALPQSALGMPVLLLLGHTFVTVLTWLMACLALLVATGNKTSIQTLFIPTVILLGLVSGYFWPLDFISKQLLKAVSWLPSANLMVQFENILLSQIPGSLWSMSVFMPLCIASILLIVTLGVTTLKK